jgi:hypothetical protein
VRREPCSVNDLGGLYVNMSIRGFLFRRLRVRWGILKSQCDIY